MVIAFLLVAIILFGIAALAPDPWPYRERLGWLGLMFFALAFLFPLIIKG